MSMEYGTETGYPVTVTTSSSGKPVIEFTCLPHGNSASCAECGKSEQASFAAADTYCAYVDLEKMGIVTFGGIRLAKITAHRAGRRQVTPSGGSWRPAYVTAVAADGSLWSGRWNDDSGNLVRLRKNRGA